MLRATASSPGFALAARSGAVIIVSMWSNNAFLYPSTPAK